MTTPRDRVMNALNLLPTDRVPRDLGGMRSTGISAFAYPHLVEALGLPPRLTRIEDTGQMLAVPDRDVLDALECDVIAIYDDVTNAFDQPELWHDYDFNGRLAAQVKSRGLRVFPMEPSSKTAAVWCPRPMSSTKSTEASPGSLGRPAKTGP